MNVEPSLLNGATKNLNDSDSSLSFDEWVKGLTQDARDWLRKEQVSCLGSSGHSPPQSASTQDMLTCLMAIEGKLAELDARLRHKQAMPVQEWFSIDETAALTGLSADHVRRHVIAGTLPVCNQGTFEKPYYRIRRSDIDAWMTRRMQKPEPASRKKQTTPGSYTSRHHGKAGV